MKNTLRTVILPAMAYFYIFFYGLSCNDNLDAIIKKNYHTRHTPIIIECNADTGKATQSSSRVHNRKRTYTGMINWAEFYRVVNGSMHENITGLHDVYIYVCNSDWGFKAGDDTKPTKADFLEVHERIPDWGADCEEDLHKSKNYLKLCDEGYHFSGFPFNGTSWFSWTECHYYMHYEGKLDCPYILFDDNK